ncbi:MAG: SNF2 helicase associated domain-containing protein, partial [Verrucomicrobiota bacterium]|nr:SNF2 helicase associated domain-containing protein [Verrucomicrobiota bacterium]
MPTAAVPITQKFLANVGGWPAMKLAQQLHQAGRVADAEYQPPLLTGMVREGNRTLRSGLRVKSESDVENVCTCRESREWGKICPHALAVGLSYLENSTAPKSVAASIAAKISTPAVVGPRFVETGAQVAPPIALHFILPPVFESAWAKRQIMLVTEIALNSKRVMPAALDLKQTYACDTFDLAAIEALRASAPGAEAITAMRIFDPAQFLDLLASLSGHPRVTFGKATSARIASDTFRPPVQLARDGETVCLRLENGDGRLLAAGGEAWWFEAGCFRALPAGLPGELQGLANGPITLRGEPAQRFLAFTAPSLTHWFDVHADAGAPLPEVRTAVPHFVLKLEGSMRAVRAELRAKYADGARALTEQDIAPEALIVRESGRGEVISLRDVAAERAAFVRLERLGFVARAGALLLTSENQIARFFAFALPQLKKDWQVQLSAQAAKVTADLQPLAPKIDVVGSGEDWFELRYSLGTADGQSFSAGELQRLLRSGQTQTRLRNGKTGVFDAAAIADFEEVLRDCEPQQNQPGLYRVSRAHSSYLAETAQESGAALIDLRGALARLTSTPAIEIPRSIGGLLRDYQVHGVS